MPRRPQRAALHPASTFPDDNSRQSPLPGPPRFATSISDLIGWLAGARHRLEDTVQRAAAAIAKVPWARPKYPKKKTKKTLSRNRTETETENAPAATAPLRTALPATGSQSASLQPVRRQSLAPASRVRSVWLRHAGLPNLPLMLHKRSCVEGVGITMEPDLRWTPPPLGPRLIPSELRNQSHATASGAAGLVPAAPGGHASAPASGAAGRVPAAPGNRKCSCRHRTSADCSACHREPIGVPAARLPNLPPMLHKRSCVEGVGITMEPDRRWTPPPLGPRLIPSELRNQSHATASGAAGLEPVAPGGHASAPASGAAGLAPVAPGGSARDSIKSGAIRPTCLSGWSPDERLFSFECHLDLPATPTSTFMRRTLPRIPGGKSMLDPLRESDWVWIRAGLAKSTTPPPEYADA